MKVTKAAPKFEPVTITLETQEELDFFTKVFANVGGRLAIDLFGNTSTIYNALERAGGDNDAYVCSPLVGGIRIERPDR